MARQFVTQEAVTEAAESILANGQEPTMVRVQAHIGGGSYTTVKRYLDLWKQQRVDDTYAEAEAPSAVKSKAEHLSRAIWAVASREAHEAVKSAKEQAEQAIAAAKAEVAESNNEIARLEAVEAKQAAVIELREARIRELELDLAEAETEARRGPMLEEAISRLQNELSDARKENADRALEAGKLMGEVESLKEQMQRLLDTINRS
jgi:hypothetical protein